MPDEEKKEPVPTQEQTENDAPETSAGTEQPHEVKKPKAEKKKDKRDEEIAALTEKLADANDKHLRLMAEYDNYRKRTQREKEAVYPDAVANTVSALLPILDNFERALQSPCADAEFLKGITMIYDNLHAMLDGLGITEIGAVGEPFDPNIHNAVMHIDNEELEKNVVSMVLQKGYRMGDKVIRCAMVQQAN